MGGIDSLRVGDVIAGKYRIDRVVGAGGMGIVVAATHLNLHQSVAIKLTLGGGSKSGERERFMREARAAATLGSDHCVRVHDVDVLPTGEPYTVMELLTGVSLKELLEEKKALPYQTACSMVIEALDAIAEAHTRGIVHRDLKPANLFYAERAGRDPIVKVLDFGISKLAATEGDASLTSTHELMGSPAYMAPEQFQSARDVDGRADLWSLGIILYELIAGRTPFPAASTPDLFVKIATAPPVALSQIVQIPPDLERAIYRCLEKNPANRFATARELAQALSAFAPPASSRQPLVFGRTNGGGQFITGPQLPGSPLTSVVAHPAWASTNKPADTRANAKKSASPALYALFGALGMAAIGAVAVAFVMGRSSVSPQPAAVVTAQPTPTLTAAPPSAEPLPPAAPAPTPSVLPAVEVAPPQPAASAVAPVTAPTTTATTKKGATTPATKPPKKNTPDTAPSSMTNW